MSLFVLKQQIGLSNRSNLGRALDKFAMDRRLDNHATGQGSGCEQVAEPDCQRARELS